MKRGERDIGKAVTDMTGPQAGFERAYAWRARARRRHREFRYCSVAAEPAAPGCCSAARARRPPGAQYIDVERCATTPERFLQAVTSSSPFRWHGADRRRQRARGVRRAARLLRHGARARRRAVHVPARRSARAADVRELPRPAPRAARAARRAGREPQSLRADHALRGPRASAAARRDRALRGDAPAAAAPLDVTDLLAPVVQRNYEQMATDDRDYLVAAVAGAHRRPRGLRPGDRRGDGPHGRCADPISALTGLLSADGVLEPLVPLLLRAAPASRARLRRAQGDPRHPRRGRAADAHRDLAAAAPHAGLDEGLSLVARGRGPGRLAAEALQLHRSAAAAVGAAALPAGRRRPTTTSRARCSATRSPACRSARPRRPRLRRRRSDAGGAKELGHYRDRLIPMQNAQVCRSRVSAFCILTFCI